MRTSSKARRRTPPTDRPEMMECYFAGSDSSRPRGQSGPTGMSSNVRQRTDALTALFSFVLAGPRKMFSMKVRLIGTHPWRSATEAQSTVPEDALQMSEEHLDHFFVRDTKQHRPRSWRSHGPFTSGFANGARNLACWHIRTALGFEHAGVAVVLSAIADRVFFFLKKNAAWNSWPLAPGGIR